jgi:hypothetical protein
MRYCFSCKRLTAGDPLFCGQCGRTYDVRLCPRLHANPRGARVCSQCGSYDLTTPQPRRGVLTNLWLFLVLRLPGVLLLLLTVWLFLAMLGQLLTNQEVQARFFALMLLLGVGWWAYTQLPTPIRHGIGRLVRKRRRGNGHH